MDKQLLEMWNAGDRIQSWLAQRGLPLRRRWNVRHILLWALGGLFAAQSLIIGTLTLITELRKRRSLPATFPHEVCTPMQVDDDEVCVYTYGQDLYDAMLKEIDGAQSTIFLDTFIWKGDELGTMFKEHLERKAAAGVQVYVIFDSFGNLVVSPFFKHFPENIHKLEYRSWAHLWSIIDPRRYARDHRKLLIVDNKVAFIGGFNIGALYATEWRDTHMRIAGSAAIDLAYDFADFWNANRKRRLPKLTLRDARPWPDHIRVVQNDPNRTVFPIRDVYLNAIERAQHHIYLSSAYFIPDRIVIDALIRAAQRDVDVRVLVPWESNHVTADWLARGLFEQCLKGGVRLFGYKHAMIHAKTCTVDSIWSTVGTANLDRLSLVGNYEINLEIRNEAFAGVMERIFTADLTNAFEITRDHWEHRPWYARVSEVILRPLRPLL